ncbi:hypothetical protein, partial [Pseudomonas sp. GW460-C8]|uniref:hypothetical protein n=1 Tax=Pseudomonas sp. GW460-C8 TaxID=2070589 RepID=UPI000CAE2E8C
LLGLAAIEERAGNFGEAEARYREMIGITEEIDFERLALNGYLRLGALYLRLERETDAEDAYCAARRIAGLANQWERAAIACDGLAKCARHEG